MVTSPTFQTPSLPGCKFRYMIFSYLSSTPPKNREYIQSSGSLPGPWESHPSVVLTEPPAGGSLIMPWCLSYAGSYPALTAVYRSFPQWEFIAFTTEVAAHHGFVTEECIFSFQSSCTVQSVHAYSIFDALFFRGRGRADMVALVGPLTYFLPFPKAVR